MAQASGQSCVLVLFWQHCPAHPLRSCCKCPQAEREPTGGTNVLLHLPVPLPRCRWMWCRASLWPVGISRAVSELSDPIALPAPIVSSYKVTLRENRST